MPLKSYFITGKDREYKVMQMNNKTMIEEPDGSIHWFNYELDFKQVYEMIKKYEKRRKP